MKKITFILYCMLTGITVIACSNAVDVYMATSEADYPLTSFDLKVGESVYHGKIDQSARCITIGDIENSYYITDVSYTMGKTGVSITPDPQTFMGNWSKEQTIKVETADHGSIDYVVVLPQLNEDNRNLIFEDNFDEDGIPSEKYWTLWPRGKTESNNDMSESYDQAYVKDGNLVLVAEKINGTYQAGGVYTKDKRWLTYGTVEVRARFPRHPNGNFPAIWLMPQKTSYPWENPISGEIDIMEHVKQESNIHQTVHNNYTYNLKIKDPAHTVTPICNIENYNVYGVTLAPDYISFTLNGQETLRYPNLHLEDEAEKMQWPFTEDAEFYLIMNMSLGSPNSWPGPVDDAALPAVMEVDWVKFYRLD